MNLHQWITAVFVAIGAFAATESIRLGISEHGNPGPGLFPFLAAALLTVLSFALFIKRGVSFSERPKALASRQRIGISCGMLGVVCLLNLLGFRLTIFLLFLGLLRLFGSQRWYAIVGIAAFTALASYFLFSSMLGLTLPQGPWGI
ncbi:MAG: tripartite tricarboxylate transporter TctB family protein [Syntrophales bacterium LBB04]|nr:tripartite tricarboxylate transporter TctB family protein [Syntrophales bacterium LBB04]